MRQIKKFPALLFFLFFVSIMFFPTHVLAMDESIEASGKHAATNQVVTEALPISSSSSQHEVDKPQTSQESQPAFQSEPSGKLQETSGEPTSISDESLTAKGDSLHSSSSDAIVEKTESQAVEDSSTYTDNNSGTISSPSEDKTHADDANLVAEETTVTEEPQTSVTTPDKAAQVPENQEDREITVDENNGEPLSDKNIVDETKETTDNPVEYEEKELPTSTKIEPTVDREAIEDKNSNSSSHTETEFKDSELTEENPTSSIESETDDTVPLEDDNREKVEAPVEEMDAKTDRDVILEDSREVLEKGEVLKVEDLAKNPIVIGSGKDKEDTSLIEVRNYEELRAAIEQAGNVKTTIKIMKSFTLRGSLTIKSGQDIIITADNKKKADERWEPIKQPSDYAHEGEDTQREIIEEARKRGEAALDRADLNKNPLPSEDKDDIIIKRDNQFTNDSLFNVYGKLTLGTEDTSIYIDGNKDIATTFDDRGSVINVNGELTMKNGVIMNSINHHGYTGPIRVNKGGSFTMEGGRISSNISYEKIDKNYTRPTAAGAVYVRPGGTFTMNAGLIDNNQGGFTGGVFVGDLYGANEFAVANINGGIIARNKSISSYKSGGGLSGFPKSKINMIDGIIAGNESGGTGGGIAVSDQFVSEFSNVINKEYANTSKDYEKFLKTNKADANLDGGLIYGNKAYNGGGVYVDTNHVNFGKTMILDNKASNWGGGVYVSFPPRVQTLKDLLITENNAKMYWFDSFGGGNGGGIWNCPTGYIHIGDGHSVYVFDNQADGEGKDITFSKKTGYFKLNDKNLLGEFYSHISPVTKDGNLIKFINDENNGNVIPDNLSYNRYVQYLEAYYNRALKLEAWENAHTFILGNTARLGGGLGSNANLETPEDKGDYKVEIIKKWDASVPTNKRPDHIKVDIFIVPVNRDANYVKSNYKTDPFLYKYGEVNVNEKYGWVGRFEENYFNGANKQEVLDRLGIKSWTDIGLPKDAFSKDSGLPFTAEELAARGYKYLFVERGDDYYVEVNERSATEDSKVDIYPLEIGRIPSVDQPKYDHRFNKSPMIYLFHQTKEGLGHWELLEYHEISEDTGWKAIFTDPILSNKITKLEYYGQDRLFNEWGKAWSDLNGFHITDKGYAFVLEDNGHGLTLKVPYTWLQEYDYKAQSGFYGYQQMDQQQTISVPGNDHQVILTNYGYGKVNVDKTWNSSIDEKDIPDSIKIYLRLDGKRVIDSYDKDGNPIYRELVLAKSDGFKGTFDKLNPLALLQGRYTLEEEDLGLYAPLIKFKPTEDKIQFNIYYPDSYHEFGQSNPNINISTYDHFQGELGDVKLHLYIDGKHRETQKFIVRKYVDEDYGLVYYDMEKSADFGMDDDNPIVLPLQGGNLPVVTYDVVSTNGTGQTEYNLYIQKDAQGRYTLYVPRLIYQGYPYELLKIVPVDDKKSKYPNTMIEGQDTPGFDVENYQGPNHQIEILKHWINAGENVPGSITIIVTDKAGVEKEVILTAKNNWKETLDDLTGILRENNYTIKEVQVPDYTGNIDTSRDSIKVHGKDQGGKLVTLIYTSDELRKALQSGNYRYELFEFEGEAPEFNMDNLGQFIKVERQTDGSYVIRYAKDMTLTEVLSVKANNTYHPPKTPPQTPPDHPPKTPPKTPPHTPPDTPEIPPKTPPEEPPETPEEPPLTPPDKPLTPLVPPTTPEEPPLTPPGKPLTPLTPPDKPLTPLTPPTTPPTSSRGPGYAPKTYDPGVGLYVALSGISMMGLYVLRKREDD